MKLFCLAAVVTSTVIPDFLGDGLIVNDSLIDEEYLAEALSTKEGRAFKDECVNSLSSYHRNAVEACDALVLNNKYRKNHAASEFTVPSKSTCEGAQAWSQYLADKSLAAGKPILEHSTGSERPGEGENLAWSSWSGSTMSNAVTNWQSEDVYWDFNNHADCFNEDGKTKCPACKFGPNPGEFKDCGHFTANVWKNTGTACVAKASNSLGV
ncbi:unnamed protein product [Oikopleura dioica]|uniref:SCP domain-containing protein n=1 Tax=Oikopleura dioica TaxID=34765 RepID=E4YKT3_OIKDI|nr:unnamed protein product [Oikopleura dioica]